LTEVPYDNAPFDDAPIDPPFDEGPFEDESFYEEPYDDAPVEHPDFDDGLFEPEPEQPKEDERVTQLKIQTFDKLHEVKDYATVHLNDRTEIASTVLDAVLNKVHELS